VFNSFANYSFVSPLAKQGGRARVLPTSVQLVGETAIEYASKGQSVSSKVTGDLKKHNGFTLRMTLNRRPGRPSLSQAQVSWRGVRLRAGDEAV